MQEIPGGRPARQESSRNVLQLNVTSSGKHDTALLFPQGLGADPRLKQKNI